jgi:hypothetical protein
MMNHNHRNQMRLAPPDTNDMDNLPMTMADLRRCLSAKPIDNLEGYIDFTVRLAALGTRETWHTGGAWLEQLVALRDLSKSEIALLADIVETCF